ncbi:Cytochrome b5-like Heme/Steroid binding domain [seawater metagenome]|uniref:Cytochrome b5-like Heme/Steroid binding domain n=1 Tax=seawater metagenome TaxID=1561972 RepID=A0A5E8CIK3_9ZZZZ
MREYEWHEIKKHNTSDDCWIVAHNKVYDVTDFIKNHPAGIQSILNKAGTDCTLDFDFHPKKTQQNIWEKYLIGKIKGTSNYSCIVM